ncbi:MFS transporter [Chryseobacterium sp. RLHN22]|uniref:MFS transporter n=1 Tax=Chryseobacterium sp. RLHN22 TaxID=3437885 RepID=UPI003D9B8C3D
MRDKKNIILILASIGTFVEALDIAIINLTIPAIQEQFNISYGTAQWLQTLYVLFFGGFLIIGGKLSDQLGRKKIFIIGAIIFMFTSLGAGLSTSFNSLALFRALQGFGAAFIMPSAMSIVINTFSEGQERNKAVGIFSSFAAIGSGSGLSIGGIITTYLSWQWVFLINVPILLITIILAYKILPTDEKNINHSRTDFLSAILLIAGLLTLTYGTHELININESPIIVIGSIVFSIFVLVLLSYRLKIVRSPLIDLNLFKYKSLLTANIAFFCLGAFFIGFLFLISLVLQKDMGYNSALTGLIMVPFSVMSALIAKFVLPKISKRLNSAKTSLIGWIFMLVGAISLLLAISFGHSLYIVMVGIACISGIGMTICFTGLSILGVQDMKASNFGIASSFTNTSYFLGGGLGLSFITLIGQFNTTNFVVGNLSVVALLIFALLALIILIVNTTSKKYKKKLKGIINVVIKF